MIVKPLFVASIVAASLLSLLAAPSLATGPPAATGDESVMPGLKRLALEAANGQSIVGSWGHRFAGPDGRLQGYGMMNSPGLPLTISLILAREAGVDDPKVGEALEKSAPLIRNEN